MHTSNPFKQTDNDQVHALIDGYPFATLITYNENDCVANHIPFSRVQLAEGSFVLRGHIARANTLWQHMAAATTVLLVFQGLNHYISPGWYPTKKEHGKVVPTWNYMTVHIKGKMTFIHDEQWKRDMLEMLSEQMEKDQAEPWSIEDAPKDFIAKQLKAIVGIEVSVDSIDAQWKLSQNQPVVNQEGVVKGLARSTTLGAQEMSVLIESTISRDSLI